LGPDCGPRTGPLKTTTNCQGSHFVPQIRAQFSAPKLGPTTTQANRTVDTRKTLHQPKTPPNKQLHHKAAKAAEHLSPEQTSLLQSTPNSLTQHRNADEHCQELVGTRFQTQHQHCVASCQLLSCTTALVLQQAHWTSAAVAFTKLNRPLSTAAA
jgi:hypothetical protein